MDTLLIVDDSRTIQKQITALTAKFFPQLKVVTASSGEEALNMIPDIAKNIAVAIFDYNMDGMSGVELAHKIKDKIPLKKIVLCTANIQEAIEKKASEEGISFHPKPLTSENFKPLVDKLLNA